MKPLRSIPHQTERRFELTLSTKPQPSRIACALTHKTLLASPTVGLLTSIVSLLTPEDEGIRQRIESMVRTDVSPSVLLTRQTFPSLALRRVDFSRINTDAMVLSPPASTRAAATTAPPQQRNFPVPSISCGGCKFLETELVGLE